MESVRAAHTESDISSDILAQKVDEPFSTPPAQYFDHLSQQVMAKIQDMESGEQRLKTMSSSAAMPYEMPQGYLGDFSQRLMSRIQSNDDDALEFDPIWSELSKEMPYVVPEQYFDNLIIAVEKTSATSTSKVLDFEPKLAEPIQGQVIKRRFFQSMRWANAAAAAVIFMILGWGGWMLFNDSSTVSTEGSQLVAMQKNNSYNTKSAQLAFASLEGVSNEELSQFIEESLDSDDIYILMDYYANTHDVDLKQSGNDFLEEVSSEDLQSYLEYEGML